MDEKKIAYIEETGLLFEKLGMTRMAGRIFGYLIVCDEEQASFDQIRKALQASKGSISGTVKQLLHIDMVEAVSLPGDRKTYYRIGKMKIGDILRARMGQFTAFADALAKGEKMKTNKDDISDWLIEVSTFYRWVGGQLDEIINKWEEEKEEIIKEFNKHYEESKQQS